jgi:hypothetical protein
MKGVFLQFLMRLSIFTAVLIVIGFWLFNYPLSQYSFKALPLLYIYFFITTIIYHYIIVGANKKSSSNFVNAFMAATTIKLFVSLLVLLIYIFTSNYGVVPFVVTFATGYLVYTSFEITVLMKHIKRSN